MRVRLTDDERNRISEHAKQAGLSISRYLIENALTKEMTSDQKEQYQVLRFQRDWALNEVARVGNNINQIARQLNAQTGSIRSEVIQTALVAVAEALNQLRRLWTHGLA